MTYHHRVHTSIFLSSTNFFLHYCMGDGDESEIMHITKPCSVRHHVFKNNNEQLSLSEDEFFYNGLKQVGNS